LEAGIHAIGFAIMLFFMYLLLKTILQRDIEQFKSNLQKDIEQFRSDLLIDQKLDIEQRLHAQKKEADILEKLWLEVREIEKNYEPDEIDLKKLGKDIDTLESFISKNEPYLTEHIVETVKAITSIVAPEKHRNKSDKNEIYKTFLQKKTRLISLYRSRLFIS